MISRSDHSRCGECGEITAVATFQHHSGKYAAYAWLCAECLCDALEVATPYKWRGQLDAFRAATAASERAKRENPRRKPGPYARAKARQETG